MARPYFKHLILCGVWALSLEACIHKPIKSMKTEVPVAPPPSLPTQQTILLQEARFNSDNLRAELASLKILMAKQAGELRSLRQQSHSIHQRENDQGLQLQNIRAELMALQAERDQFRKQNMELESQVANIPNTTQIVSDIQEVQGSFQQIMSKISGLVSDITLIKQQMGVSKQSPKPQQTKLTQKISSLPQTTDAKGRVLIHEGDTLWELSRMYGTTVDQIREWNKLSSDLIRTGFWLKVMVPTEAQSPPATPSGETPAVTTIQARPQVPVVETGFEDQRSSTDRPSEPTHILSIGGPSSDSPESP